MDYLMIKHPSINDNNWVKIHAEDMSESGSKSLDAEPNAGYTGSESLREVNDLSFENPKLSIPVCYINTRSGYLTRDMLLILYRTRYDGDNPILLKASSQGIPLTDLDGNEEVEVVLENYNITWQSRYRKINDEQNSGLACSLTFKFTKQEFEES